MFIVGIAGGTCSGKTTLSAYIEEQLGQTLKVNVLHMDKYFKNPTPNTVAPFTGVEYPEHNHPDSFKLDEFYADLESAAKGDADVLVVEGLLILHLERVRKMLDLKIFVDLPSDERLIRRVKRFMRDRGQTMEEVAERYLDTVRYRHAEFVEPSRWYADVVVNGNNDLHRGNAMIVKLIEACVM